MNSVKAKAVKLFGGAILLLSFIVQNFLYDSWNQKSEDYYNSNKDFSDMSRSSLLYLNLYFNTKLDDDSVEQVVKYQYINAAAQKAALGQVVNILARDTDKVTKINLTNSLLQKAKSVNDFDSFLNFNKYASEIDKYSLQDNIAFVNKVTQKREMYRWIFLSAYILGTGLLLFGLKYE